SHFFSERDRLTSVRDAYLHLLYQLADPSPSTGNDIAAAGEEKLRQELYGRIKTVAQQNDGPLILVFDGLDEAEQPFWPPVPLPLPAGLRVIASARTGETKCLEGWADASAQGGASGSSPLILAPLDESAVREWLRRSNGDGRLSGYAD